MKKIFFTILITVIILFLFFNSQTVNAATGRCSPGRNIAEGEVLYLGVWSPEPNQRINVRVRPKGGDWITKEFGLIKYWCAQTGNDRYAGMSLGKDDWKIIGGNSTIYEVEAGFPTIIGCEGQVEAFTTCQFIVVPSGVTPPPVGPGPVYQPTLCKEGTPQEGIETALGCIPTKDTTGFIAWILKFAIGIGGGIAFILMLIGVFQIITSSGDPERLKAGKELITSALIGLLMIIFSIFLLKLIGMDILQIPGFGTQTPGGGGGGTGKNLLM